MWGKKNYICNANLKTGNATSHTVTRRNDVAINHLIMEASNIKKLFKTSECFIIPAYQRAYSWGHVQREQFIQDLRDASDAYYLGHFLFEKEEGKDVMYLIDGQQRLTTVVIFFSCLKHALENRSDLPDNKICKLLANQYLRDAIEEGARFETVEYDKPFFENEIIDRKEPFSGPDSINSNSKRRIRECREYFDKVFEGESTETLLRWMQLVEDAKVTEFHVTGKAEAAQIFAFQNDRGKALTQLEVLKSFFMLQIFLRVKTSGKQKSYIDSLNYDFRNIYESIVNTDIKEDDILRYFWMAYDYRGYYIKNVVSEVESEFKTRPVDDIVKFVNLLARAFVYVVEVDKDNKTLDIANIKRIRRMAQCYPLMIRCKIICNASEETYRRTIKLIENIIFRAAIRGGRAEIESRLNGLRGAMHDDESIMCAIDTFIERMKWDYWNDGELKNALNSGGMYYNKNICRYVLWRYEQSLCPKDYPATRISWENIMTDQSLEHIAPQTPTDGKPVAAGYGIYSDIEHQEEGIESGGWLNCLGNMMLLTQSQNSAAGNHPLKYKLSIYEGEDSLIRQQHEIRSMCKHNEETDEYSWDKDCIKKRLNLIVQRALQQIWNLDSI